MLCKDCEYFKIEYQPIDKDINVRSKDEPQIKGSKRLLKGKDEQSGKE